MGGGYGCPGGIGSGLMEFDGGGWALPTPPRTLTTEEGRLEATWGCIARREGGKINRGWAEELLGTATLGVGPEEDTGLELAGFTSRGVHAMSPPCWTAGVCRGSLRGDRSIVGRCITTFPDPDRALVVFTRKGAVSAAASVVVSNSSAAGGSSCLAVAGASTCK